jgi:uncharacterized lipoprotein YajG
MFELIKNIKLLSCFLIGVGLILSSCAKPTSGTGSGKMLSLDPGYKYKIEKIDISDEKQYEVDVKKMLRSALEKTLQDKNMLWDGSPDKKYYGISLRIIDYEMGNAFKRWLLPTYGSTILSVHTDITDLEKNEIVSFMEHKQTVAAGGLYSVGAWDYIFDQLAKDIAIDLERKFTGKEGGFFVQLDPWLEKEIEVPKSTVTKNIYISSFQDLRSQVNIIGERTALKVSMGDIYANRDVLTFLREAVQNELLASGNNLTGDKNSEIILSGELIKFWVQTPSTLLYWDIIGEIEFKLIVSSPKTDKSIEKIYKAQSQSRTYVWPTEKLLTTVVADTVKFLMYDIRKESIWTTL